MQMFSFSCTSQVLKVCFVASFFVFFCFQDDFSFGFLDDEGTLDIKHEGVLITLLID